MSVCVCVIDRPQVSSPKMFLHLFRLVKSSMCLNDISSVNTTVLFYNILQRGTMNLYMYFYNKFNIKFTILELFIYHKWSTILQWTSQNTGNILHIGMDYKNHPDFYRLHKRSHGIVGQ